MTVGFIFDIKRFALHDGPGLRTSVFFKGCPLSCLGCHNPEGQKMGPELVFRPDRCTACGDCLSVCPTRALALAEDGGSGTGFGLTVDGNRCDLTGACVGACLPGALEIMGRAWTAEEVVEAVEKDLVFFEESNGGVTLTGGEPFSQSEFLKELLSTFQERGIGVVLDTCGHVAPETFRALAPGASHLLFDLKLMDSGRHEAFTGVQNHWILENLRWVCGRGGHGGSGYSSDSCDSGDSDSTGSRPGVTVRIPLVPGVNDDSENLRASGAFLSGLPSPPSVDLLPYHRLGEGKYGHLGRVYGLAGTAPPTPSQVRGSVSLLQGYGLRVTVRGEPYGND